MLPTNWCRAREDPRAPRCSAPGPTGSCARPRDGASGTAVGPRRCTAEHAVSRLAAVHRLLPAVHLRVRHLLFASRTAASVPAQVCAGADLGHGAVVGTALVLPPRLPHRGPREPAG